MPRYRPSLLTALLLPLLACATATTQAREVAAPADHVQADGPYVFRQGDQLQASGSATTRSSRARWPRNRRHRYRPRCGYEHTVHVAAPNAPSVSVLPAAPRIVALSDIHGQYGLLVRLLRAHQVIDAQDRWALGKDTLVIAGDVFDRGPQVTEAFWLLYGLQQQAAAAGGAVHFVLGNHETMVLYDDLRYVNPKYLRSAQLLGRSYPQLYGADSVIGQWLRTRPVLLKIGDTLFLHGGISPEAVQLALDPARTNAAYQASLGLPKAEVKADPATAPLYDGKTSPIWYRGYFDGRLDTAGCRPCSTACSSAHRGRPYLDAARQQLPWRPRDRHRQQHQERRERRTAVHRGWQAQPWPAGRLAGAAGAG
jgi:hypothetical protein